MDNSHQHRLSASTISTISTVLVDDAESNEMYSRYDRIFIVLAMSFFTTFWLKQPVMRRFKQENPNAKITAEQFKQILIMRRRELASMPANRDTSHIPTDNKVPSMSSLALSLSLSLSLSISLLQTGL
jgi:hypothetical protein